MSENPYAIIALELAILARRVASMTTYRKTSDLDRSHYLLLHQMNTHGSAGVKTLAEEFHLNVSTVSRQAASLEEKGFATRIPDPGDGRAFTLQITPAGERALMTYRQERTLRMEELLAEWTEQELKTFGHLLAKFNRTF
jgi:DNA-binding MarR family transcriptional regulator